jgi:flagellar motor protein MotB
LTTWVALADFFAAIALVSLALYGHQRQENIRVTRGVKDLARRIHEEMDRRHIENRYDEASASIVLPEDTVRFASGDYRIGPEYRKRIEHIAEAIKAAARSWHEPFIIVIRGHTDAWPVGQASEYKDNYELSWRRALEVDRLFGENGIKPPNFQIAAQGVGQEEPLVDNCRGASQSKRAYCASNAELRDVEKLSANRRIELRFGHFSGGNGDVSRP